jgi:hypothetical protein
MVVCGSLLRKDIRSPLYDSPLMHALLVGGAATVNALTGMNTRSCDLILHTISYIESTQWPLASYFLSELLSMSLSGKS